MTAPASTPRRILIVDDEPFVCEAVKMMLAYDGHSVEAATNGEDALALLAKSTFDVVITDYAMPRIRGDELAATIKARNPKQPVVMVTAYAEMLAASAHPLPGVDLVISKPFLLDHLREAMAKVIPPDHRDQSSGPA
ncbi:MAG TPA: response regulator [Clostridia bacterium]|nr:response regulator [Clostridia bacterium]